MTPSWRQVFIRFDAWDAAEHTAVTQLAPLLADAEAAGLVASWFFVRKAPCWRLRFLPSEDSTDSTAQDATTFIHQRLDTLHEAGRIARWVTASYEPEAYAFGGPAAMDTAHHLFHHDSRHILSYLGSDRYDWAAAFHNAGTELGDLARNGTLRRGLRAVLAHHVIFAWNRIGLSHTTQSLLANVAQAVVLGQ